MTLNIVFGFGVLVGIAFAIWQFLQESEWTIWRGVIGWTAIGCCLLALVINLFVWIPSKKDSEITYRQLIQEKRTVEIMIATDRDIDRLLLNERVIDYNNRVISIMENSRRPILREYYSWEVDWSSLGLIHWG